MIKSVLFRGAFRPLSKMKLFEKLVNDFQLIFDDGFLLDRVGWRVQINQLQTFE